MYDLFGMFKNNPIFFVLLDQVNLREAGYGKSLGSWVFISFKPYHKTGGWNADANTEVWSSRRGGRCLNTLVSYYKYRCSYRKDGKAWRRDM